MRTALALAGISCTIKAACSARSLPSLPPSLPAHPRLIWTTTDMQNTLLQIEQDASAGQMFDNILEHGYMLQNDTSKQTGLWDYMYTYGFLHRMECAQQGNAAGNCTTTWSTAGIAFLLSQSHAADVCNDCGAPGSASNCTGMNFYTSRSAGLCTATLGQSLGIGYDWFYNAMTVEQRRYVAAFLARKQVEDGCNGTITALPSYP